MAWRLEAKYIGGQAEKTRHGDRREGVLVGRLAWRVWIGFRRNVAGKQRGTTGAAASSAQFPAEPERYEFDAKGSRAQDRFFAGMQEEDPDHE
jgi:hypothetical protein